MAASSLEIDESIAHLKAPYVGLRPFERDERAIFFGRELDAGFLKDKIFSARLTLLYAPSGVGKSSILRTLVAPALEEQHAWVKYFDNWTGDDPCSSMKTRLVQFATELEVEDAGMDTEKGPPTLTDIISRIATKDDRTAILILDQFEEFLVTHGKYLDPLRKELAALVRAPGLDVRIVFSLRQEFLAALEPFRNEILNLFQSTYLLDSLDGQGLRDAIEKPVEFFGGEYEHELTEQLVADLSASEDREAMATSKAAVDLPMMQIICERLWKVVENRDPKRLTLALYKKELGGKDKILETYVHEVMPRSWSDKLLTARLMRLLAPASGLKKPYTAAELASNDGLNYQRVTAELERLEEQRILKEKEYRGQKLYELQHDAFVRFISPWRDDILRQERMRRRLSRLGIAVGVVLAFAAYYVFSGLWHDRNLMDALAHESQEEWRENAVMSFDSATTDLLFRWKTFGLLNYWLHKYEKQIPDDYGLANAPSPNGTAEQKHSEGDASRPSGSEKCDFLCVHYSEGRSDDEGYINAEWRNLATSYFASRGIPVPTKLQFKPEPNYGSSHFAVTSGKQLQDQTWPETVLDNRKIPINDNAVFLSRSNLKGPAADFFDQYHKRWSAVPADDIAPFGPYTIVPGWLRPVWRVSGSPATDIRGLPAIYLASALLKNPEPLFGQDAMQVLLTSARKNYPQTVSEALAARGYDNLRKDLAQLVRLKPGESLKDGESLTNLPMILDALAAYPSSDPANTPEAVADKVSADLHKAEAKIPARLLGPWKGESFAPAQAQTQTPSDDYTEIQSYIPGLQLSVKVYMGRGLQDVWFNDKTPILNPRLYELRDKVLARYGVELRPPLVYTPDNDDPLPSAAYRIETVASRAQQCQVPAQRITNASDADVDRFLDTIESCIVASGAYWVMAEDVNAQRQRTSPAAAAWLNSHYSLTDQKFLMRAVFAGPTSPDQLPPEYSLRHSGWLMRSLVFWTHVDDPHDTMRLAASLRETQRARLKAVSPEASNPAVARLVGAGISALQADQMSAAETDFTNAITMDRTAAVHEFLALYPGSLRVIKLRQAATFCSAKDPPYRDTGTQATQDLVQKRIDLQETLDQWKSDLTPDQARRYGLCLLSSYRGYHREQVEIGLALEKQHSNPADWTPEEARWLGEKILNEYDPYRDSTAFRDGGALLIKSAVVRLPEADSRKAFGFVVGTSDEFALSKMNWPGPKIWRLTLLRELTDARPEPANLFDLANQLYQIDHKDPLEEVLRITDRAKQAIANEPDARQREREMALVYYYRASTLERLSDMGVIDPSLHLPDRRAEADQNLEQLKHMNGWEEYAATTESEFVSERGDYARAIELSRRSMTLYPKDTKGDESWYEVMLTSQLLANDPKGAAETANRAEQEADELKKTMNFSTQTEQASLMFTAALGQLVTGSEMMEETGRDFLTKDHPYVPYIAMMLYARIASAETQQEARGVLTERWEKADRPHWKQRLQGGDETAWREMLIGLYLDELKPQEIFDPIKDDESFAKSDLHFLPMSRQEMLCEAYFYSALLAESKKDMRARDADLRRVIDTKVVYFTEYAMAKYMLSQRKSAS